MKNNQQKENIVVYQSPSGSIEFRGDFKEETIWANLNQIAEIFDVQKAAISKHLKNIYATRELSRKATVSKMETVQTEGKRSVKRRVEMYNMDAVIAVGYRVNSRQATRFRIWATKTLREHLIRGYTINEKRLLAARERFTELQNTIAFLQEKSGKKALSGQHGEILNLLASYSRTLTVLEQYDKGRLQEAKGRKGKFILAYDECVRVIGEIKKELMVKKEAGDLFGKERHQSLEGIIKGLYQTFGGKELYSSLESKAAHLLYFIIKDHPFADGNKRSASFLFVYFLDKHNALYRREEEKKINDNALTALALLIAESDPVEKEQMIALITQLLA